MTRRSMGLGLLLAGGLAWAEKKQEPLVLLRFPGVLKAIDKKRILLEVEGEQELEFRRAKKIRFFDNETPSVESKAPVGQPVVVEGRKEMNGDLMAYRMTWNEPPKSIPL